MFGKWFKKRGESGPTWTLDDPAPRKKEAPYTFFVPTPEEIDLLVPGDLVKLIFRSSIPLEKWDAEKMWVEISDIAGDVWSGVLANQPDDMPQLRLGATVNFERQYIIDYEIKEPQRLSEEILLKLIPPAREYWDRCLVDDCVLEDGVKVAYLYREQPKESKQGDKFKDSGWRIRGDARATSDAELESREMSFVALGAVLNKDDSFLHLIDEPVGSEFERNFANGWYFRVK